MWIKNSHLQICLQNFVIVYQYGFEYRVPNIDHKVTRPETHAHTDISGKTKYIFHVQLISDNVYVVPKT